MTTTTTAATSWGAEGIRPLPPTRAQKTEARTKAEEARLAALPVQCQQWADALDLDALDAMSALARRYREEGYAAFRLHVPDLARGLGITTADAEERLARLQRAGAVQKTERLGLHTTWRPVARDTGGSATVTSAKGERATFAPAAPGSLLGRLRRD